MDSSHKTRTRKLSAKNERETAKDDCNCPEKPTIRLRSMSGLVDKNKPEKTGRKPRGYLLNKALKNSLKESAVCSDEHQPVVDVVESIINRKMTYAQNKIQNKQCKTETKDCQDCDLETVHTSARFGKVYPSPNEKFNASTGKNNNPLTYATPPESITCSDVDISLPLNLDCSDIDISSPISKEKIHLPCDMYPTDDSFEPVNHIPSIFGKVYVKKPPNDMNFLKKSNQELLTVKTVVDKCASGKRKRSD